METEITKESFENLWKAAIGGYSDALAEINRRNKSYWETQAPEKRPATMAEINNLQEQIKLLQKQVDNLREVNKGILDTFQQLLDKLPELIK